MKHNDLPERWAKKLKTYLREKHGADSDHLSAADFSLNQNLRINFQDGSFAFFRYAFYLFDRESNEIAVFTEHCGYHIFPSNGIDLELLESKWIHGETE